MNQNELAEMLELETCVSCGNMINVSKDTHINCRPTYIPAGGDLCLDCFNEIYFENKSAGLIK